MVKFMILNAVLPKSDFPLILSSLNIHKYADKQVPGKKLLGIQAFFEAV
ncbi:MAG: hypothetical protein WB948_14215 [Desulfobaccales bacterium]